MQKRGKAFPSHLQNSAWICMGTNFFR